MIVGTGLVVVESIEAWHILCICSLVVEVIS